jgi:hypothetical protein
MSMESEKGRRRSRVELPPKMLNGRAGEETLHGMKQLGEKIL